MQHFVEKHTEGGRARSFSKEAVELLCNKTWPGNIRELDNVVDRLLILGDEVVTPKNVEDFVNL